MKILYAASEALPYASTGGLADVAGALPKAIKKKLGKKGDVRVVLPLYTTIRDRFAEQLELVTESTVHLAWRNQYCGIWKIESDGVTFYFIDNQYYFERGSLYGCYDDGERFAFFSKCILELMALTGFYPDVLHANDWQTALSVIYLKRKYAHIEEFRHTKTLFTIHNIDYQGQFDFAILGDVFELAEWDRSTVEYNGRINLLKGAITCSDMVNTVSRTYADEIQTEYYSSGLHYILREAAREGRLTGIVNGIDVGYYDPATDPDIAEHFTANDRSGKAADKADLQRLCGFPEDPTIPLVCMVSRLASHKGFELVRHVLEEILATRRVQFALLGTGEQELEDFFLEMERRYPGKMCARIEYNKALSKKFYAGADLFLMPSKSEPCGLAQMIASRYGAVPIVRECGGLADTIHAYNEYEGTGNGFSFHNYNAHEMMAVIDYAIGIYADREKWQELVTNVMTTDFSWNVSAEKYLVLYQNLG